MEQKNKEVIIFGAGTSIIDGIKKGLFEEIKTKEVWSCNFAFMTFPFLPKREIWTDVNFFKKNIDAIQKLYLKGVPCYSKEHSLYKPFKEINARRCSREMGDANAFYIGVMGLSGYFALHLAIHEGYSPIYILGYDYGNKNIADKKTHYYQDKLKIESCGIGNPSIYLNKDNKPNENVKDFVFLANKAKEKNLEVYNVSLESHIDCFKKISWDRFFQLIKSEEKSNE